MPLPHLVIKVTVPSSHQLALPGSGASEYVSMALQVVLVILSLLPLLEAQNPEHANIIGKPITNDTLSWVSASSGPGSEHYRWLPFLGTFPPLSASSPDLLLTLPLLWEILPSLVFWWYPPVSRL